MKKKKMLLLSSAALVIVLIVASVLYQQFSGSVDNNNLAANDPAANQSGQSQASQNDSDQDASKQFPPDFTVLDSSGKEVKLSDFRGKPTAVNFWATWCGYCVKEMPAFEEVYRQMEVHLMRCRASLADYFELTLDIRRIVKYNSLYELGRENALRTAH